MGCGVAAEKPFNTWVPHRLPCSASLPGRQGSKNRGDKENPSDAKQKALGSPSAARAAPPAGAVSGHPCHELLRSQRVCGSMWPCRTEPQGPGGLWGEVPRGGQGGGVRMLLYPG